MDDVLTRELQLNDILDVAETYDRDNLPVKGLVDKTRLYLEEGHEDFEALGYATYEELMGLLKEREV